MRSGMSTPQRFKRSREKGSPNDLIKIARVSVNVGRDVSKDENEDGREGNEDIFNNEAMENPTDEKNERDGDGGDVDDETVQFK